MKRLVSKSPTANLFGNNTRYDDPNTEDTGTENITCYDIEVYDIFEKHEPLPWPLFCPAFIKSAR